MPKQTIMYTTVPAGFEDRDGVRWARLAIHVSFRLEANAGATLGSFPDLRDWPARLLDPATRFAVKIDDESAGEATLRGDALSSALWTTLFHDQIPVAARRDGLANRPVMTYSVSDVHQHIRGAVGQLMRSSPGTPPTDEIAREAMPELHEAFGPPPGIPDGPTPAAMPMLSPLAHLPAPGPSIDFFRLDRSESLRQRIRAAQLAAAETINSGAAGDAMVDVLPDRAPTPPATGGPGGILSPMHDATITNHAAVDPPAATPTGPTGDALVLQYARAAIYLHGPVSSLSADADDAGSPSPVAPPTEEQHKEIVDFHRMLAALSDHPEIMRRLGLIIQVAVPSDRLRVPALGQSHLIAVVPELGPPPATPPTPPIETAEQHPHTAYMLTERLFLPAPRPRPSFTSAPLASMHGLLNLSAARPNEPNRELFELVQVDVDGAAMKILQMVETRVRRASQSRLPPPLVGGVVDATPGTAGTERVEVREGTPSLVEAGISLVRAGHANDVYQGRRQARRNLEILDSGQRLTMYAEDVTRGYRVDVRDLTTGHWYSLHARTGIYTINGESIDHFGGPVGIDEGAIQLSASEAARPVGAEPTAADPILLHESLIRWQGWSLAAPRPGKTIDQDGSAVHVPPRAVTSMPTEISARTAPGTLPRLRFGRRYQVRVRLVDITGGGLTLDEANAAMEELRAYLAGPVHAAPDQPPLIARLPVLPGDDDSLTYRRYQPVVAPILVLREALTDGESIDRLVIRGDSDLDPAAYAAHHPGHSYTGWCDRHVVPAKVSQLMAETSGMFDEAFGPDVPPAVRRRVYAAALREEGSLELDHIYSLDDHGEIVKETLPDASIEAVTNPKSGAHSLLHHEASLRVPYLADPLAQGATLWDLPGTETGTISRIGDDGVLTFSPTPVAWDDPSGPVSLSYIDFHRHGVAWPDVESFRLRLIGGDAAPVWDDAERVLTVAVPPGEEVTIRLSSYLSDRALDQLGVLRMLHPEASDLDDHPLDPDLTRSALGGLLWPLTPAHTIHLAHALQHPKEPPRFERLRTPAMRESGQTFVYVDGLVKVHRSSTAHVDIIASWTETVDDPSRPTVDEVQRSEHVFNGLVIPRPGEQRPPRFTRDADGRQVYAVHWYDDDHDALVLQGPLETIPLLEHFMNPYTWALTARHEFGDTRHRSVTYQAVGVSRFASDFPAEIRERSEAISSASEAVTVEVRSSAPPPMPRVLYVMPAFEWEIQGVLDDGQQVRIRRGNLIRVFLGRPWYITGDGEALGLVFRNGPDDETATFAWSEDPIHVVAQPGVARIVPPSPFDAIISFPRSYASPSLDGRLVALHTVSFDPDRTFNGEQGVWYADIQFNLGDVYCPFVRLGLVRAQESALGGMHLSPVVVTEPVQLAPDRTVTITRQDATSYRIDVTGLTYVASMDPVEDRQGGTVVEVSVERRRTGAHDEAAWMPATPDMGTSVTPGPILAPDTLWTGSVGLPADRAAGIVPDYRVVIKEFELFHQDAEATTEPGGAPEPQYRFEPARRLVFADAIML